MPEVSTKATVRLARGELLADRYLVGAQLGQGGMGTVYDAWDNVARSPVALKVLHPELTGDPHMRRRFFREAAILRQLVHPGIVRIRDAGEDRLGRAFLVMERLEGRTLADRLACAVRLSPDELSPLLRRLGEALDAAHEEGVLHGDLKPQNVFLVGEDDVVLVDFGASKVFGLERLTATGQLAGTPAYLAPEVVRGERALDLRLDVYALGVLAYEALAGRRPFASPSVGRLLASILTGDYAPLDLRAPVTACVDRALAIDPEERFASAGAFARAFDVARGG
jgi:serine/threonine protein kinase